MRHRRGTGFKVPSVPGAAQNRHAGRDRRDAASMMVGALYRYARYALCFRGKVTPLAAGCEG